MTRLHRTQALWAAVLLAGALGACEPIGLEDVPAGDPPAGYAVEYVVDGDTITVSDAAGDRKTVRLLGINTPEVAHDGEPGQCGGEEATAQLEELLPEGTPVELLEDARADDVDRYDRLLRYVQLEDGTDAGRQLITDGRAYAWAPSSEPDPERLADYEDATAAARDTEAGSWATCPEMGDSR